MIAGDGGKADMDQIFTIGHSNHSIERFVNLLLEHRISLLADIRSAPFSAYLPQFNRDILQQRLRAVHVEYVFLGGELGARPTEESCYVHGQARYDRIKDLPTFREGLARVLDDSRRYRLALMCAEADPVTCHRSILVARELKNLRPDIAVSHIHSDGSTESQEQLEERLVHVVKLQRELFGELSTWGGLVERAYQIQAERIAYRKVPVEA